MNNCSENGESKEVQPRANLADIAWLAGIVDGEGHIMLTQHGNGVTVKTHWEVTMSNLAVIYRVRSIVQALTWKKYPIKERRQAHQKHVSYCLRVYDQVSCRKLCEALLPHLTGKKELADTMIEFCEVRKASKHKAGNLAGRPRYGNRELVLIEKMRAALKNSYTTPLEGVETKRTAPALQDDAIVQCSVAEPLPVKPEAALVSNR